ADDLLPGADAAGHAEDELEVERRREEALGLEGEGLVDVADLVALQLDGAPGGADAGGEVADEGAAVDEDIVAEVEGAAVECGQLRLAGERLGPLVDAHAHGAAGGDLDDHVGLLPDPPDGLGEELP